MLFAIALTVFLNFTNAYSELIETKTEWLGATEIARTPSQYYDWKKLSDIFDERTLNPKLSVEQIKKILGSRGSFEERGSDLLFTFSDGGKIKISHKDGKVTTLNLLFENLKSGPVEENFQKAIDATSSRAIVWRSNTYYDEELKVHNALVGEKSKFCDEQIEYL
jgi:hypothetical protein